MTLRPQLLLPLIIISCSHSGERPQTAAESARETPGGEMRPASLEERPSAASATTSDASADERRAAERRAAASPEANPPPASPPPAQPAPQKPAGAGATPDPARAKDASSPSAPDNTRVNERDRDDQSLTPVDQSNDPKDLKITQRIRQAVMADGSLSFTAKNVKIITQGGKVTLRGPVKNQHERDAIEAAARKVAGTAQVDNQLEVKE